MMLGASIASGQRPCCLDDDDDRGHKNLPDFTPTNAPEPLTEPSHMLRVQPLHCIDGAY